MFYTLWIIVQICIEALPLSSSGHQFLFERTVQNQRVAGIDRVALEQLNHALHAFQLLILAFFFRSRIMLFIMHPIRTRYLIARLIGKNFVASLVTALIYFTVRPESIAFAYVPYGFMLTALILLSVDYIPAGKRQSLTILEYALLGVVQACALVPGVSRFASTYACARFLGLTHRSAFEVCFSIQVPLIMGALMKLFYKGDFFVHMASFFSIYIGIVCLCAMFIAYQLLRMSERWAYEHHWKRFAFYMIIPITAAFMLLL